MREKVGVRHAICLPRFITGRWETDLPSHALADCQRCGLCSVTCHSSQTNQSQKGRCPSPPETNRVQDRLKRNTTHLLPHVIIIQLMCTEGAWIGPAGIH